MISSREDYYNQMLLDPSLTIQHTSCAGTFDRRRHEIPMTDGEIRQHIQDDAEQEQKYWQRVDQEKERGL